MKKSRCYRILFVSMLLLLLPLIGFTANAQDAQDYAPILYFEGGETCYPVAVDYYLDNSELKPFTTEQGTVQYYDNLLGTVNDNNIVTDYQNKLKNNDPSVDYTVYYRIDTTSGVIQYWMFYVFNPGENNQHEGDWEMVQIILSGSSPTSVAYSQHYSGQQAVWDMVEKDGNHFKVYVSRGSHANYLRSYSGKLGVATDIVGSNGKILNPADGDYKLVELSSQDWLNNDYYWGEISKVEDFVMGRAGPQGPLYRQAMTGAYMKDGASWDDALMQADGMFFQIEWFLYNFVLFLIIITVLLLAITIFKIYRRHKKYGLGPRYVSMLYIDGPNLHTIGNILCIVAIIVAFLGLFNTWYTVSVNIDSDVYSTSVMNDVIKIDGINGMQLFMPTDNGPVPMAAASFPFTYVFVIGFILMILATIGIYKGHKLGLKYIFKGIRMIVIVVVLIVIIALIGNLLGSSMSGGTGGDVIGGVIGRMGGSPTGGSYSTSLESFGIEGTGDFAWGLGIGAIYLIVSGILFLVAGILMILDKKDFFQTKIPEKQKTKGKKPEEPTTEKSKKQQEPANDVCPICGDKLEKNSKFCTNCGKKI